MKTHIQILWLIGLIIGGVSGTGGIFKESISQAMMVSKAESRNLILYFRSADCTNCNELDAFFERPEIRAAIDQDFVAALVDIADFDGKACSQIYSVSDVPAIVIVDQRGNVVYKAEKIISTARLADVLDPLLSATGTIGEHASGNVYSGPTSTSKSGSRSDTPVQAATSPYSVQLGFFSQAKNAERLMNEVAAKGFGEIFMRTEMRDSVEHYRVLVGHMDTMEQAVTLQARLKASGYQVRIYK